MESDLISVIVPIYKTEKYLDKCIKSIVDQTYRNLEIILVDDGSPDQCGAICDTWAEKDARIKVIHKPNGGLSDARNAGLDIAVGEYVAFVDSDDYIDPVMYEELYRTIKEYNADLCVCGYCRMNESDGTIVEHESIYKEGLISKGDALKHMCCYGTFMIVWNKLFGKEILHDLRFPFGKYAEDAFILPAVYDRCSRIASLSKEYYYNVISANSLSRSKRTVKHLDGVEAYYRFLLFCENKGYTDLLQAISAKMIDLYMMNMNLIQTIQPRDKKRVREIKNMVRYSYLKYGDNIKAVHKLYVEAPALYHILLWIRGHYDRWIK